MADNASIKIGGITLTGTPDELWKYVTDLVAKCRGLAALQKRQARGRMRVAELADLESKLDYAVEVLAALRSAGMQLPQAE